MPDQTTEERCREILEMASLGSLGRKYLPDLIYGANDGVVTTLAVISGVVGASLSSTVILILGFANLLADGFSMGASNVLARRSGTDDSPLPAFRNTARHGLATFAGFVVAGFIPLLAYLVPFRAGDRFGVSVALALLTLFAVGAGRALFTPRGAFRAGLEMLLVGSVAAGLAYLIGAAASLVIAASD
jgi:VIT1/CCC1 family predicted Fe2+/Mn2+ transporter